MKRRLVGIAAAILCLPLASADAQLSLRWSGGVLGSGIGFEVEGPVGFFALLPSTLPGPTPLGGLGPGFLEVGLDLQPLWVFGVLAGPGSPTLVGLGLPNNPALSGMPLYAQAVRFPGAASFIDLISNPIHWVASFTGENHRTIDEAILPRRHHSATELLDGRVLLAGGAAPGAPPITARTWKVFVPQRQSFDGPGGLLPQARLRHTASLLPNGRVLLVGGTDESGNALASTALFDPTTNLALFGPPLPAPRVHHTATVLADGRVLVIGGALQSTLGNAFGYPTSFFAYAPASMNIYDPVTVSWSSPASLPHQVVGHRAALLPDGRVLITGGVISTTNQTTTLSYTYDPVGNVLAPTASLPIPLAFHMVTPTLDGRVLVAGGSDVDPVAPSSVGSLNSYLFDIVPGAPPATGAFSGAPSLTGIIQDGQLECLPGGTYPPVTFPSPPTFPTTVQVVYFAAGGYSSVDLAAGTQTAFVCMLELDTGYTAWTDRGSTLSSRPDGRMTPIDGGLRLFFSGVGTTMGGGTDLKGEIRVRDD